MTPSAIDIRTNTTRFMEAFHAECARLNRDPDDITIVAVSKTFPATVISAAIQCGLTVFGENRVQETKAKIHDVIAPTALEWHLIGHFQTNKAKDAVDMYDLIHSVDREEAASALNHRAEITGKTQNILIQLNTTAEPQKSGCDPAVLDALVAQVQSCSNLRLQGLMTIGPFVDDHVPIARAFQELRRRFDQLATLHPESMRYCSMGMTNDWRIALAEGANMLRIGRALFGERG